MCDHEQNGATGDAGWLLQFVRRFWCTACDADFAMQQGHALAYVASRSALVARSGWTPWSAWPRSWGNPSYTVSAASTCGFWIVSSIPWRGPRPSARHIFSPGLAVSAKAVRRAKAQDSNPGFAAQDAANADRALLIELLDAVVAAGASAISLADTTSRALPGEFSQLCGGPAGHGVLGGAGCALERPLPQRPRLGRGQLRRCNRKWRPSGGIRGERDWRGTSW